MDTGTPNTDWRNARPVNMSNGIPIPRFQWEGTIQYDEMGKPISAPAQCGVCGRWWDDAIGTSTTPTPSGRCPFEYEHDDDDDDEPTMSAQEFDNTMYADAATLDRLGVDKLVTGLIAVIAERPEMYDRALAASRAAQEDQHERARAALTRSLAQIDADSARAAARRPVTNTPPE
jgi:hypothetical protein